MLFQEQVRHSTANEYIGSNRRLTERQLKTLKIQNSKLPNEGTEKFRFKNGYLEILIKPIDTANKYSTWVSPHIHPSCCFNVTTHLEKNRPIISGGPNKLARAPYLKGSLHQTLA